MTLPNTSVAVVTYERPAFVARCLGHLLAQTVLPTEIIVVDSSSSDETRLLVQSRFPTVRYEVCPAGRGATATARNIAYRLSTGEVLAFLDDDAYAEPDWLEHLLPYFADPTIGAVGGRQIRHQPGELDHGKDVIGRLQADGTLTGNFAADPGGPICVDHLLGANMSFRRAALDRLGGIRDGYRGTCIREETDLCFQVVAAGYHLVYAPDAVVEHVAGPYAKGRRFDLRYTYWAQKNHLILLLRNFGPRDPVVRAYLSASARETARNVADRTRTALALTDASNRRKGLRSMAGALSRLAVVTVASVSGMATGIRLLAEDRRHLRDAGHCRVSAPQLRNSRALR